MASNGGAAFWTKTYTYINTDTSTESELFFLATPLSNVTITFLEDAPLVSSLDPNMETNITATGLILDTVSLQDAPLPEPSTIVLGLIGAGLIWGARGRTRSK